MNAIQSNTDSARDRVLFVDDAEISSMRGVERRIHAGEKHEANPVVPARDWERDQLIVGTVLRENGVYRMWYTSSVEGAGWHMYAESDDGTEWRLPSLGLYEDPTGGTDNNVFLDPATRSNAAASVMHTPHMGEERQYSIAAYVGGNHHICFSRDGLGWTDWSSEPIIPGHADVGWFMYDDRDMVFRGMVKRFLEVRDAGRRIQNWTVSEDGFSWTMPLPAVVPDTEDDAWTEGYPGSNAQIYGIPIVRYGPLLLGFMEVLRATDATGNIAGLNTQGVIDVQLISSRDGRHWERVGDRTPVLELGQRGAFDGGFIRAAKSLVDDGGTLRFYYTGMDHPHGGQKKGDWRRGIGMASWRKDGLVGLAADGEGEAVTAPMQTGGELHVNADASRGRITAELLDRSGAVVRGYEGSSCVPLEGDSLDHTFQWEGERRPSDVPPMEGSVRLRLHDAEVFSLWFAPRGT